MKAVFALSKYFPGGAMENHEKSQSVYSVFQPRFEARTSRI
jgi:hypothetical protein